MFQTASGVYIPFPERIKEEFEVFENRILFNLSFEKMKPVMGAFLEQLTEPLFFVLELPLMQQEEEELRKSESDPFHKKVCYLDGQTKDQIKDILVKYGDLLLHDGMSQFALASHVTGDEIYIQKYKIITIYSKNPTAYITFLEKHGLVQTDNLLTVWNTFTRDTPGSTRRIELDGIDAFDVYDELVKLGMYDAKIVEG
ncbi:MAG: hypothetical protein FWE08_00675 [Oscillospiraceae bacterium]|nr:hypothetical protein [Oscillospiraceae bacterium]